LAFNLETLVLEATMNSLDLTYVQGKGYLDNGVPKKNAPLAVLVCAIFLIMICLQSV